MDDFFRRWEGACGAVVLAAAACLVLYNLGHAPFWHDEAVLALMAKNLYLTGEYTGWDGRTLLIGGNGTALNSALAPASYPPWPALPSALGIAVWGMNETGVRFFHALLGLLSLPVFWLLLRLDFPRRPRLRLLALALFGLSTQVVLYMRLGRYAADAMFFALLALYCYRLYFLPNGRLWHLAVVAAATVLGFLNHFAIAVSLALALAAYHLLFHFRETTRRQWIEVAVAGAVSAGLCLFYLIYAGIILSGETLEYSSGYDYPWWKRRYLLVMYNFRDLLHFGWLPLWVALWILYRLGGAAVAFLKPHLAARKGKKKKKGRQRQGAAAPDADEGMVVRWGVLLALFLFISAMVTVRSVSSHPLADMRYLVPGLPLCALLAAAFVDWLWRVQWGAVLAPAMLALLLLSNVPSWPYIFPHYFTMETVRWLLPGLVGEIQRPYATYSTDVVNYLNANAKQDETIFVAPWQDYAMLQFYLSDKLVFCCGLNSESALPEEKVRALGAPLYQGDVQPMWVVAVNSDEREGYEVVFASNKYGYPTQRPELEFHLFKPLGGNAHVKVFRRIEEEGS